MKKKPVMGLTLGDATGIGSELVAKTLQSAEIRQLATWVVVGDERVFQQGQSVAGLSVPYVKIANIEEIDSEDKVYFIDLHNLSPDTYSLGQLSEDSGQATGETLTYVLKLAQQKSWMVLFMRRSIKKLCIEVDFIFRMSCIFCITSGLQGRL